MTSAPSELQQERQDTVGAFVAATMHAWKQAGVEFLVLRNYQGLPDQISNDLDILVSPDQVRQAEQIMISAANGAGFVLHNRAEFGPRSLFFHHPEGERQLHVDLFDKPGWRGIPLLSAEEMLARRIEHPPFFIPAPEHEALLNLLVPLLYNNRVKTRYAEQILGTFQTAPEPMRNLLAVLFGSSLADQLMTWILGKNWTQIERVAPRCRRTLLGRQTLSHPLGSLFILLREGFRLLRRFLRPPGLTLALLGPDGSGKSSIAPRVMEGLRDTFARDKGLEVHWKPVVFFPRKRASRQPVSNPHGQPPRSVPLSLMFLLYHWLEYLAGSLLQYRRVVFRNGLVMIDRHYYDFYVDPGRYRLQAPTWAIRLGATMLPKPDLVFLLDAPAEVLQARKQEVAIEETRRQREAFLSLVRSLPNGHVIDASLSLDCVAAEVQRIVLGFLTERTRRRIARP